MTKGGVLGNDKYGARGSGGTKIEIYLHDPAKSQ